MFAAEAADTDKNESAVAAAYAAIFVFAMEAINGSPKLRVLPLTDALHMSSNFSLSSFVITFGQLPKASSVAQFWIPVGWTSFGCEIENRPETCDVWRIPRILVWVRHLKLHAARPK